MRNAQPKTYEAHHEPADDHRAHHARQRPVVHLGVVVLVGDHVRVVAVLQRVPLLVPGLQAARQRHVAAEPSQRVSVLFLLLMLLVLLLLRTAL